MRKPAPPRVKPLSLRAFARGRGVSLTAVQRAIADGRLTKRSVGQNAKGQPYINDPEEAAREWEGRTRPRIAANQHKGNGAGHPSGLALATQHEREARAKIAEFEYLRKIGEYVRLADYKRAEAARIVAARTAMMALPTRAKQRLPHLMSTDLVELDKLIREALDELAERRPDGDGAR